MVSRTDLVRVSEHVYEVPAGYRDDMRVPARVYADDYILEQAEGDRSLEQLVNVATLPGVVGQVLAMPDMHQGYGFPIGGVAATALPDGVISPGGVGYDINCGVRLLSAAIDAQDLRPHIPRLLAAIDARVGTGVGASGSLRLGEAELRRVLEEGAGWAVAKGYGTPEDLEHTEERGRMTSADANAVSARAQSRGRNQVGTLGAGNHFLEIDEVTEIYDQATANAFGLVRGRACVWIHCGSRGLGHQVCTDAVRVMQQATARYGIRLPDRELAAVPFDSPEGQQYFAAMSAAANYAWANRQVIAHLVRETFAEELGGKVPNTHLAMVYDVCHNIAKVETHEVGGSSRKLCVHRKGATRAFGPGRPELSAAFRHTGHPVLIPGDMGTGSYVLVGTEAAMQETFGSSCHGAGRVMSRSQARRSVRVDELRAELEREQIVIQAGSRAGLVEEAPQAYKDLDRVVNVVHEAGIARRVARTRPLGVIKG